MFKNYYLLKLLIFIFFSSNVFASEKILGPGDDKTGYDSENYTTKSSSIKQRIGKKYDISEFAYIKQLGLPKLKLNQERNVFLKKAELGKKLFFDRRLSINNTFSCAMCHIPEQGFTNNELQTAVGIEGRSNLRNSPTLLNVVYNKFLFHDGREFSLQNQIWQPLLAHSEMAMPSIGFIIKKLKLIDGYIEIFEDAYPRKGISVETISDAIASYEMTLISGNSKFDQWFYGKDSNAISDDAKKGFEIFAGKGNCIACHTVNKDHALFIDNKFHNTGIGYVNSMGGENKNGKKRVQLSPGNYVDVDVEIISSVNQQKLENDLGLYRVTENPNHRWLFRTPTLRNITETAPYMHDGSLHTLEEVVDFYDNGGHQNELLSPLIKKLNLTKKEKRQLIDFMKTLTGENLNLIVLDAISTPVGDLSSKDPSWGNEKGMGYD